MMTLSVLALLCVAADDVELIKEEMAAIRKELVRARMELRRIDARKASDAAMEKLGDGAEASTEFLNLLAGDHRLHQLARERELVTAKVEQIKRTAGADQLARLIAGPREELEAITREIQNRREKLAETLRGARKAKAEAHALYWIKLNERLEKDLATLRAELKKAGG